MQISVPSPIFVVIQFGIDKLAMAKTSAIKNNAPEIIFNFSIHPKISNSNLKSP